MILCFLSLYGYPDDTSLSDSAAAPVSFLHRFPPDDVRPAMIWLAVLLLRRASMNGVNDTGWTSAGRCLCRCCIGHWPGRWFQSVCYASVHRTFRFGLRRPFHFPFSLVSVSLLRFSCADQRGLVRLVCTVDRRHSPPACGASAPYRLADRTLGFMRLR